jgi:hypothetical protein
MLSLQHTSTIVGFWPPVQIHLIVLRRPVHEPPVDGLHRHRASLPLTRHCQRKRSARRTTRALWIHPWDQRRPIPVGPGECTAPPRVYHRAGRRVRLPWSIPRLTHQCRRRTARTWAARTGRPFQVPHPSEEYEPNRRSRYLPVEGCETSVGR